MFKKKKKQWKDLGAHSQIGLENIPEDIISGMPISIKIT